MPPPVPESREQFEEEPPRRREREQAGDFAFEEREAESQWEGGRPRRVRTGGTAAWMYVAFGLDVFLAVLLLVGNLTSAAGPGADRSNAAGGVLCFLLFMALSPFVLLAAIFLIKLTNRGLVMTGGIMAIIIGSFAVIGAVITVFAIAALAGLAAGRLPPWIYLVLYGVVLLYLLVALVNFIAGIKTLVTIANPAVKESFR